MICSSITPLDGKEVSPRRGLASVREKNAEEVRRLYLLVPDDLTLLDTVPGDAHRLALALQLVWGPHLKGSGMRIPLPCHRR